MHSTVGSRNYIASSVVQATSSAPVATEFSNTRALLISFLNYTKCSTLSPIAVSSNTNFFLSYDSFRTYARGTHARTHTHTHSLSLPLPPSRLIAHICRNAEDTTKKKKPFPSIKLSLAPSDTSAVRLVGNTALLKRLKKLE